MIKLGGSRNSFTWPYASCRQTKGLSNVLADRLSHHVYNYFMSNVRVLGDSGLLCAVQCFALAWTRKLEISSGAVSWMSAPPMILACNKSNKTLPKDDLPNVHNPDRISSILADLNSAKVFTYLTRENCEKNIPNQRFLTFKYIIF